MHLSSRPGTCLILLAGLALGLAPPRTAWAADDGSQLRPSGTARTTRPRRGPFATGIRTWGRLSYASQKKLLLLKERWVRARVERRVQRESLVAELDRLIHAYPEVHERYAMRRPHISWDVRVLNASWLGLAISLMSSLSESPLSKVASLSGLALIGTGLCLSRVDDLFERTAKAMAVREALRVAARRGELADLASPQLVADLARHLNRPIGYPKVAPQAR